MCSRVREPRAAAPGECAPAEQFRPGASRRRTDPQPAAARTRPARPPAAVADRRVTMSPPAPNPVDAAALADELARFRVVDPARMSALLAEFPGDGPDALAEYLVRRGALTHFQADRRLPGEAAMLALGPYRLTDVHRVGVFGPLFRAELAPASRGSVGFPPPRPEPTGRAFAVRVWPLRSLWRAR